MNMTADASRSRVAPVVIAVCATALLAACQSGSSTHAELAPEPDAPAFTAAEYGVDASPRVTNLKQVRKGGGRDHDPGGAGRDAERPSCNGDGGGVQDQLCRAQPHRRTDAADRAGGERGADREQRAGGGSGAQERQEIVRGRRQRQAQRGP